MCPEHGADPGLLLQRADVAMYAAKAAHSGIEVYAADRDQYSPRRLADRVGGLLAASGLSAGLLTLEITEGAVMTDPAAAIAVLHQLAGAGVRLSIDDSGTGYSSLAYLKRLPVDEVKLDRSFVLGMTSDPDDAAIVRSTVELARNLGLRMVAEGVEDQETWDALAAMGCELAQGYHLARPMPAGEATEWLAANRAGRSTMPAAERG
jgi:EAL domain-containing protein (putative c-di-GMP-specific phosphodiesterase class I)